MLDAATRSLPPVPDASWLKALPPAMRFVLHGDAQVRTAAAPAWGAGFSEHACRTVIQGSRATLWLGPDEYLLYGADEDAKDGVLAALELSPRWNSLWATCPAPWSTSVIGNLHSK
jgi:hypothetical protein